MKITFHGAANEVTGSCYLLEQGNVRFLIDCGMFQGPQRLERLNVIPKDLHPPKLNAVVLTHGHLDHCGRLPMLVKAGFRGPIYATQGTIEIATLILRDAAHIQSGDIKRENRRRQRAGLPLLEPLFDDNDVSKVVKQFKARPYYKEFTVEKNVSARFVEAGHILGSSCVELFDRERGNGKKYVFSGDLGPFDVPLMRDPSTINGANFVFVESTYGDRDHRSMDDTLAEFKQIIIDCTRSQGKILIPTFAVGRTQQLLYYIAQMFESREINPIPVYLDSPMAIAATEIYARHSEIMDEHARMIIENGHLRKGALKLTTCETAQESMSLNDVEGPCIIMAGAGMCTGGRILHHFKHNLWKRSTVVLMVGYQAQGTIGKRLLSGVKKIRLFGETISVNATINGIGGFSAHAGQTDLLKWLKPVISDNPRIFVTHGERRQSGAFRKKIKQKFGLNSETPELSETVVV